MCGEQILPFCLPTYSAGPTDIRALSYGLSRINNPPTREELLPSGKQTFTTSFRKQD